MAKFQSEKVNGPGVYSYLVPLGINTIQGVGTGVAAFVGVFSKEGATTTPTDKEEKSDKGKKTESNTKEIFVIEALNFNEYLKKLAKILGTMDFTEKTILRYPAYYAVWQYFQERGTKCYVVAQEEEFLDKRILEACLNALAEKNDISIVAAPQIKIKPEKDSKKEVNEKELTAEEIIYKDIMVAGIKYCCKREDAIFVADSPKNMTKERMLLYADKIRQSLIITDDIDESIYGALYYPQVVIQAHHTNAQGENIEITVPPSAAVCGIYSRIQAHIPPAGTNAKITTAQRLERSIPKEDYGPLNDARVNCLRYIEDAGNCVFGARTLTTKRNELKYVNVIRLSMFIEESIHQLLFKTLFKPITTQLYGSLIRDISSFLRKVWESGALFGAKEEDAFRVEIDPEKNTADDIRDGKLTIDIRIAPVKPAEFILLNIHHIS